jgi:Na+-driven multidrug efflux pump
MAAPLVVSFWMRAAVTFVDTVFAATIGEAAVAAVGLTLPLEFLMIAVWAGLSTGLTSALARAMGARRGHEVDPHLRTAWRLVAMVAPPFVLLGLGVWVAAPRLGLAADVAQAFRIYGTVLIGGSALTTFWSVVPDSLVKAHQDTRATMWAGICTNCINLGLNALFVFAFHWGVFGIAFSTVLGRLGGLAYALHRAAGHEARRRAADGTARAPGPAAPYGSILGLAVPTALTFGLMAAESALINGLLASLERATEAIAAYAIYYRVVLFGLQPVVAASVAMLPFAARLHGARDRAGLARGLRQAHLAAAIYALAVLGPVLVLAAPALASGLTESPLTARYTTFALRAAPVACLVSSPFLLCRPVFEAMGRGRPGLLLALLRCFALTVPLACAGLQLAEAHGRAPLYGLIAGTLLAGAVASSVFLLWLRSALSAGAGEGGRPGPHRASALEDPVHRDDAHGRVVDP